MRGETRAAGNTAGRVKPEYVRCYGCRTVVEEAAYNMSSDDQGSYRGVVFPAVNPDDGSTFDVTIPPRRLEWATRIGKGAVLELAYSVPQVLKKPTGIYEGLCRDDDEAMDDTDGWLCYCGIPDVRYDYRTGHERSIKERVLLVFVNEEKTMYHHRWEKADPMDLNRPADLDNRFKKVRI